MRLRRSSCVTLHIVWKIPPHGIRYHNIWCTYVTIYSNKTEKYDLLYSLFGYSADYTILLVFRIIAISSTYHTYISTIHIWYIGNTENYKSGNIWINICNIMNYNLSIHNGHIMSIMICLYPRGRIWITPYLCHTYAMAMPCLCHMIPNTVTIQLYWYQIQ